MKQKAPSNDYNRAFHYTDFASRKPTRDNDPYRYQAGFGNRFQSEVIPGTLPSGQNMPMKPRFGLYIEGLSYSAFTAPRAVNISTFTYRVRPSVVHSEPFTIKHRSDIDNAFLTLNPRMSRILGSYGWKPFPLPPTKERIDFVDGIHALVGSGDPNLREGLATYVYAINSDMDHRACCNTDGDFLLVPQLGSLDIQTEMGKLFVQPGEICVIPRGLRFTVRQGAGGTVGRGYITEIWGSRWELPELGPLGTHGLANARDFLYPMAQLDENLHESWTVVLKANGEYTAYEQDHSPFDVVAWHGNFAPYKASRAGVFSWRFPRADTLRSMT